ncbi:hypothetical protein IEU95_05825 [Hoyosella rhizosphaerae]|uniref:Uncharacterized protein n=1 Tax=Hoyosella rhizosphaerae TaxID=1755582 RepID=A0A916XBS3_9ACTN|nr:hypothetical protein [Hoyosella rhizosphaerae]MBN4926340.1 hypothetical protein [Hoyosella rhizosphaerae]GGC60111.1 hypothetical protein GCM10011410_10740 [Hoyosella rhizosphaerae]
MTTSTPRVPDPSESFRSDVDPERRRLAGEIDPGIRALVAAVFVLLLLGTFALPHTGSVNGWQVLTNSAAAQEESIKIMSQLFVWFAMVFGVGFSILGLVRRRWIASLVAAGGSFVGSVLGMLAIWSRQTPPIAEATVTSGPGIGLVLGLVCLVALFLTWFGVALTRSPETTAKPVQ